MSRTHTIEETIKDVLFRGDLVQYLKDCGKIPKDWVTCSLLCTQKDRSSEIEIEVKRSYAKD